MTQPEFTQEQIDNAAIRKMIADELRKTKPPCTGLARKVETGFDHNPRTLAAIEIIRKLTGLPPSSPID